MTRVLVLPGDGIGPEVISVASQALTRLAPDIELQSEAIGWAAWQAEGQSLPDRTQQALKTSDATLLGAVTTPPHVADYRSPVVRLRKTLDLYCNLRPLRSVPHACSRKGVDLLIVRENSEGLYVGRETRSADGQEASTERRITRRGSERILDRAFRLAGRRRKQVCVLHKANVMRATCGLFLEVARDVAKRYPDVEFTDQLVDSAALKLFQSPESFDVICTTNLFGDIISDLAAGHVGGLGLAASANLGEGAAVFEPVPWFGTRSRRKGQSQPARRLRGKRHAPSPLGSHRRGEATRRFNLRADLEWRAQSRPRRGVGDARDRGTAASATLIGRITKEARCSRARLAAS